MKLAIPTHVRIRVADFGFFMYRPKSHAAQKRQERAVVRQVRRAVMAWEYQTAVLWDLRSLN